MWNERKSISEFASEGIVFKPEFGRVEAMAKRRITLNMEKEFTYGQTEAKEGAQIVI